MDNSEKYAKMSEAEEIQSQAPRETGDVYFLPSKETRLYGYPSFYWLENYGNGTPCRQWVGYYDTDRPDYYGSKAVWLPRQDQLQEMLAIDDVPIMSVAWVGYLLCLLQYNIGLECTSMEQLWLTFVMQQKYNKVWDGEKWGAPIKEDASG